MIFVEGLLDRMLWVLETKEWKPADWARHAQLKQRTHVSNLISRLEKNPNASVDLRTAAKLAAGANVSLDWLALGTGTPAGPSVDVAHDPLYPTRGIAVAGGRVYKYADEAISRILAEDWFEEDPGLDYWISRLREEHFAVMARVNTAPKRPLRSKRRRKRRTAGNSSGN